MGARQLGNGVIVLGTHRSGTSAVTAVAQALGLHGPQEGDRFPTWRWNARGNQESRSVAWFDEELLRRFGGAWWAPPLLPAGWAVQRELDDVRAEAWRCFSVAYPVGPWVWKDPRACVLMSFWDAVFGADLPRIVVVRHPLESAASLWERNGLSREHALALGDRNLRSALRDCGDRTVFVTAFDHLIADPEGWCVQLAEFLEMHGVPSLHPIPSDAARSSVDAGLRHQNAETTAAVDSDWEPRSRSWAWAMSHCGVHAALSLKGLPDEAPETADLLAAARNEVQDNYLND